MTNSDDVLVLHRRTRTPCPASLHCREIELRLADDGQHIVLNRYVELYRDEHTAWCSVQQHCVPLASLIRWMVSTGERLT